jgi:hypothetical protein
MRRFTSLSLLVLLILLVVAAPAGAKVKLLPTEVEIAGGGFTQITSTSNWQRVVGEGTGTLELGDLYEDVGVVMTQRFAGWDGKYAAGLLGKTVMGDITITAANGDVLVGTYRGEIYEVDGGFDPELPLVWAFADLTFRRGTGQFRGVTGTVEVEVGRCFSFGVMGFGILPGATVTIR